MRVFKSALKLFFRHPIYLLIYVVWLSFMGVFMGLAANDASTDDYVERPTVAVIDRDGSELSSGLEAFVREHSEWVELEDSMRALQDATMQQRVSYIAIIPEGFADAFERAAVSAGDPGTASDAPEIETVISSQSYAGTMMDNLVNEYLSLARTYVVADPDMSQGELVQRTGKAMTASSDASVVQVSEAPPVSARYLLYMQFASYTILLSIAVCTSIVMSRFNESEVHRRNAASPATPLSRSLQVAAACFVIMLVCWAFVAALGLAMFGRGMAGIGAAPITAAVCDLLAYSLFGLGLGFLMGQVTGNEVVMNAVPNVVGLVCSFLGGVWISLDLVGEPIATIAKLTPTYYYNEALKGSFDQVAGAFTTAYWVNLGMIALFAAALFAMAFALVRSRRS